MPNTNTPDTARRESLGPAEHIISALLSHGDHLIHNRPGIVTPDACTRIGVKWSQATHKVEDGVKVAYRVDKGVKRGGRVRVGVISDAKNANGGYDITVNGNRVAEYRPAGIFPESALWMYKQVAEVWRLDNEFAARWASYAYTQTHRDLKMVMAAFMLVQTRRGDLVQENGVNIFADADYRDVGEAMMLLYEKKNSVSPKMLLRIHDLLALPAIAQVNRDLGFGQSSRKPFLGRWPMVATKWLRYREENPRLLRGLLDSGYRSTVRKLCQRVGYRPASDRFFADLRWRQSQAADGRRTLAIGKALEAAETWEGLSETEICERITRERLQYKRITGLIPPSVGMTRAIMAASIEAGALSNKDLVILTPTIEELGLLDDDSVRSRWEMATKTVEDMRAANIAKNVKSQAVKSVLQDSADTAIKEAVKEAMRDVRLYVLVDKSSSMQGAIEQAKAYLPKFLQAFPPEKVHVGVFDSVGREVIIPHASAVGVENAFRGLRAEGGTSHGAGLQALARHKPSDDEDLLVIFIGDEEDYMFEEAVRCLGLSPAAFGLIKCVSPQWATQNMQAVQRTAAALGIPCFMIDESVFEDVYAIPRTFQNLIKSTPVGRRQATAQPRETVIDIILKTDLLEKPAWA